MLYLVDTSIWADHIGRPSPVLKDLLHNERVLGHSMILGEILLGNLRQRKAFEVDYRLLVMAEKAEDDEVLRMIEAHKLYGSGIGFVDGHILASAFLTGCGVLTRDKRLAAAAESMGIAVDF